MTPKRTDSPRISHGNSIRKTCSTWRPALDRIDIHIEVPAVPYKELTATASGSTSQQMRDQVIAARELQRHRFGKHGRAKTHT